jgi:hypothetical protein
MLTETLLMISSSVIGRFSPVGVSHWMGWKTRKIDFLQAAFGTIFHDHRRVSEWIYNVAVGSLKRVTERIFTISKCFHRSKEKLQL